MMVVIRSIVGNILNLSGFMVYIVISNIIRVNVILNEKRIFKRNGGRGKIIIFKVVSISSGVLIFLVYFFLFLLSCCNIVLNFII